MEKIIVNRQLNQVKLSFNPLFYKTEFIDKAIQEFDKICSIEKSDDALIIEPKIDLDIELLGYEFYNYVLCLSRNL